MSAGQRIDEGGGAGPTWFNEGLNTFLTRSLVFASGMAASAAVVESTVRAGDHLVASRAMYWSFRNRLVALADRWGLALDLVDTQTPGELERAVRTTSREVSREAKRSHSYQDRTRRLTRSIAPLPTTGRFLQDSLEGGVTATMRYASYVEEGTTRARAYQYLGTAWLMQRDDSEQRVEDALEAALTASGLR